MTRFLLDTNHAGTLLRDEHAPLWSRLRNLTRAECALCRPVIGELWFMVFNSARVAANRQKLEALLAQFDVWEFDDAAAIEFGALRTELRRVNRCHRANERVGARDCRCSFWGGAGHRH